MTTLRYRNDEGYEMQVDPTLSFEIVAIARAGRRNELLAKQQVISYVRCPETNELTPVTRCINCNLLGRFEENAMKCRSTAQVIPDAWDGKFLRVGKIYFNTKFQKLNTMATEKKLNELTEKMNTMLAMFQRALYEGRIVPTDLEVMSTGIISFKVRGAENLSVLVSDMGSIRLTIAGKSDDTSLYDKLNTEALENEMNRKYNEYLDAAHALEQSKNKAKIEEGE